VIHHADGPPPRFDGPLQSVAVSGHFVGCGTNVPGSSRGGLARAKPHDALPRNLDVLPIDRARSVLPGLKQLRPMRDTSWITAVIHEKVRYFRYHVVFQHIWRSVRSDRPLRNVGRQIGGVERNIQSAFLGVPVDALRRRPEPPSVNAGYRDYVR
jgi:hypothetical protein